MSAADASRVVDALVRIVALSDHPYIDKDTYAFFSELTATTPADFDDAARKRLTFLVKRYEASGQAMSVTTAKELLERIDLPF
jgi:hypothetical protein